jgi:hypothetical protein
MEDSPRLLKVRDFLRRHGPATTLEIIHGCEVCAVNSIVAVKGKQGVYRYELIEAAQLSLFRAA